ncbi:VanZ family protein [Aurantivibrio plasticivorans]
MTDTLSRSSTRSFYSYIFGFLLIVTTPLLFLRPKIHEPTGIWDEIWNLGHIPFFAIISYFVCLLIRLNTWAKLLGYTLAVLVVSIVIEFIQANIGRSASLIDVGMNLTGAMLVIFWLAAPNVFTWIGRILASAMLITVMGKTSLDIVDILKVVKQMPVIANFETELEFDRWRGRVNKSVEHATEGAQSGRFRLRARRFTTFELSKIYSDWRGYKSIQFDIFNPYQSNLILLFHIQDNLFDRELWNSDRFRTELVIKPGQNQYTFALSEVIKAPKNRELDISDVKNIRFTSPRLSEEKYIYIDNIHLK